ncbi:MAG: bifunctional riboflavin kinase/FAD synthetase [Proteobacteria bacterium]|nr:MAG: bifunctional riboflavin kinase/FAD synthetase [Pseudomonadota bacterium]
MHVYKGMTELTQAPKNSVVTIGNFDGVHLGHQELIGKVAAHAKKIGGTAVAITFRPHPHFVLRPTEAPHLINTYEEKTELLRRYGADYVIEQPFSREFSNITPDQFVSQFLVQGLDTKVLYLGYDFAFGKERAGSVETLQRLAESRGIEIHVVPPFKVNGTPVSSSLIRKTLDEGAIPFVNECLGRPFFLTGLVWRGEGRGRTIGVPTANLQTENRKYPRVGVYATRTHWRKNRYESISNIGYNPTFKGDGSDLPLKIETHLFDFNEDMYGDEIRVEFYEFLRAEKKFNGVNELLAQIGADSAAARAILSKL